MTCSRESILAMVKTNGISKRYIIRASSAKRWHGDVYDQRFLVFYQIGVSGFITWLSAYIAGEIDG